MTRAWLIFFCMLLGGSLFAQESPTPIGEDYKKFEALRVFLRDRRATDCAITTPNGIDEARYVQIGGIDQWITIRGEDRNNPIDMKIDTTNVSRVSCGLTSARPHEVPTPRTRTMHTLLSSSGGDREDRC